VTERALIEQAGNGDLGRARQGEIGRIGQADDGGVREHGGMVGRQVVRGIVPGGDQQHQGRDADRAQLQPVLEALDEGDSLHSAHRDVAAHDHAKDHHAHPVRCAEHPLQRDARALHLRQQVEPADDEDQQGRHLAQATGPQTADREVRDRVRAEAAQRRRHEQQQDQVTGGVAHRVPQRAHALRDDEPGDAEEGRGRQVLARDGGGVDRGRHLAGRDHEVVRRPGHPDAARADHDGQQRDERDRSDRGVRHRAAGRPDRPGR
jgi:hypothetical protein